MGRPSIAFRLMLSPLVLVLGLVMIFAYGQRILHPDPDPVVARSAASPTPRQPNPRDVRELRDGPNRGAAAWRLEQQGFTDPAWLPILEQGVEQATSRSDQLAFQCLILETPHPQQAARVMGALSRTRMAGRSDDHAEGRCALKAARSLDADLRLPLVDLLLALAEAQPWSMADVIDALSGLRVEPLPEPVTRRLLSTSERERLQGVKLALSLGAGDFAPDLILASSRDFSPPLSSVLRLRRDPGSARFLARRAFAQPADRAMLEALVERERGGGSASATLVDMALDEAEPESVRTAAIEFLAFNGKAGACRRLAPLRASPSESVRAYATAALMEPPCRG